MDILGFSKQLKKLPKDDLVAVIKTQILCAETFADNLGLLVASKISLDDQVQTYAPTKSILKDLHKALPPKLTLIEILTIANNNSMVLLDYVKKYFEALPEKLLIGESITVKQANLLNLVNSIEFWHRYNTLLLETLLGKIADDKHQPNASDLRLINGTLSYYIDVTKELSGLPTTLIKVLDDLAEIVVEKDTLDILISNKGFKSVDALNKGFGIHNLNPIYYYKDLRMDFDLYRLKSMRDDNEFFASRIEQINQKRNGVEDPQLDYRIKGYQDRIIKNRAKEDAIRGRYA